jgi:hypothetical protein
MFVLGSRGLCKSWFELYIKAHIPCVILVFPQLRSAVQMKCVYMNYCRSVTEDQGGVTTRHLAPNTRHQRSEDGLHPNCTAHRHDDGLSAALLDKVRALNALPRLGALRTLYL